MNPQDEPRNPNQQQPPQEPLPHQTSWPTTPQLETDVEPSTGEQQPAENPLGESINASPVTQAPLVAPAVSQPEPQPLTRVAKRSKKPLIIGLIAAGVLLIGGAAAAYQFWYQNPDKVVTDSIMKALAAETVSYTGTLDTTGEAAKLKVDLDGSASDKAMMMHAKATVSIGAVNVNVDGSLQTSENGDLYYKIANAKDLADTFVQMMGGESSAEMDALVAKIDNKWIKLSADELKQGDDTSKNAQCFSDALKKIETDEAMERELTDLYQRERFVVVKESLGEQNGSLGYKLDVDRAKAKAFVSGVKTTKLYAELQKCDKEFELDENGITKNDDSDVTTDVEIWANKWTHDLTKVKVAGQTKDGSSKGTFVLNPTFNKPVSLTAPTNAITTKEIQAEFEKMMSSSMIMPTPAADAQELDELEQGLMNQDIEQ